MSKEKELKLSAQIHSFENIEYYNHLQERIIILNSEIDDDLVEKAILQIIKWNREDDKREDGIRPEIEIILNSPGGVVDIGLILCEVIRKSKTKVVITTLGLAASMGSLILMAGHHRKAYEYSNVLIHDGSMFIGGTANKVKDHMKFQEEKEQQIKEYVLGQTKITSEKYDEMSDREWWLTAKSALEYGIIDEII
jgi:ATP-dependent Clp protease, protease subunit